MSTASPHRYFVLHKPYNMVSQFISPDPVRLLNDIDFDFPEGTHAIGRLDNHSEGLLLLTTNKKVTRLLFEGSKPHVRKYLIQVKQVMTDETLQRLKAGVPITVAAGNTYIAKPVDVVIVNRPADIQELQQAYKIDIPQTWLIMTLTEGKYHQVRKMVKAVKHPCKRLIRIAIEDIVLENLPSGSVKEMTEQDFFSQLNINYFPDSGMPTL